MVKAKPAKPRVNKSSKAKSTNVSSKVSRPIKTSNSSRSIANRMWSNRIFKMLFLPALIYFILFCLLTWPWITHFNGWFMTDTGDGLQNVWNMWWIKYSVTTLHQLPWHTSYLHAPFGVTLVGQTLNPINGFAGIILQQFMSLNQAFNTIIIFAFVFGGVTMFWLCRYFTGRWLPSLLGGMIFTFSSYHFAHAIGHMQLVSLEFIPLYILLWWRLLKQPSYSLAAGAAVCLLLVLLCDYYYFLYSLILSLFIAGYLGWRREIPNLKLRRNWLPFVVFGMVCLVIVAPLPLALLRENQHDVFTGAHDARIFSTDILTPFLDGGFWHFGKLTAAYYTRLNVVENTVYLGISVLVLIAIALKRRAQLHRDTVFWLGAGLFFGVMSLGPRLYEHANTVEHLPLPYAIMERVVPGMRLSGVPVRMMVMVTFAAAILGAIVLSQLRLKMRKHQYWLGLFIVVFLIEMWPLGLPVAGNAEPKYVLKLKSLPSSGSVLDNAASAPFQLLHQTAHEHKMVLGYISRQPLSLNDKERPLIYSINHNQFDNLCQKYGLRYIASPAFRPLKTDFPVVYRDHTALIYDLKNDSGC